MARAANLPSRNPLPQLIPQRLRHVAATVRERIWENPQDVPVWISKTNGEPVSLTDAKQQKYARLEKGSCFGRAHGSWEQIWMKVSVPAAKKHEKGRRYLLWHCQGETTVWLKGRPWAGLDAGHRYCPLPDTACELYLECCMWQTAIWLAPAPEPITPYGLRFDGAQLALRNPLAWEVHCDLDVIGQLMEDALKEEPDLHLEEGVGYCRALEKASPRLRKMLHHLGGICDAYQAPTEQAQGDLVALRKQTRRFFADFPAESWQPTAAICGHAHIDLVWLWPEAAADKKIVHSFATVMRLMEQYPEKTFVQSMPALYRSLEKNSPALFKEVQQHIASGRWEVMGAFEVEPDNNLPGGEALARSIRVGQNKIRQLQGKISETAWIPDVFGYSNCLPQIMKLGGVNCFYTTKMTWSCITRFPYTSFTWRGADGSEVLSHLGTVNYNGEVKLDMNKGGLQEHRQVAVHDQLLLPTGYGDGGGGPTDLHCERARRFKNVSGSPKTEWTTCRHFFENMANVQPQLPIYQGELYLEYHRGTYTTQSEFKRLYRRCETALQAHEAVRVARGGKPLGEAAWLRVLFAHFHDAIPGSSIREVYEQMNPELQAIGDRETRKAIAELEARGAATVAFNTLPFARQCVVETPNGLRQMELPALASTPIAEQGDVVHSVVAATPRLLDNGRLRARFSAAGELTGLLIDGEKQELAGKAGFVLSPDDPALFDAWDIDHHGVQSGTRVAVGPLNVVEHSPLRAVLESAPQPVGEKSRLTLRYVLDAGSDHLRIEPVIDWQETHKLLRYYLPTDYQGRMARFGCPFGSIERPQLSGIEADEAMWEVPGSRWAAVQRDGGEQGLAICAESKLGYSARDGVLSISLLRSAKDPDPTADMGTHTMPFAIGRYQKHCTEQRMSTAMAADHLFAAPIIAKAKAGDALFAFEKLAGLAPSWAAPSETLPDGYFVRLHETAGGKGTAVMNFTTPPKSVRLVNFLEEPMQELNVRKDGSVLLPYAPYKILTVQVER